MSGTQRRRDGLTGDAGRRARHTLAPRRLAWALIAAWAAAAASAPAPASAVEPATARQTAPAASPRNIILMIGDGMGFHHVAAAGLYAHGRAGTLACEKLPLRLAMSTYPTGGHGYDPARAAAEFDYLLQLSTDSAAAATALSTGVKTDNRVLGLDPAGRALPHLLHRAKRLGKAAGVVTSVPFSHATPAGFVVRNPSRGDYAEIARQMILESDLDVIMGCGHPDFDDAGLPVTGQRRYDRVGGQTLWQQIAAGLAGGGGDGDADGIAPWRLVQTEREFAELARGRGAPPRRVLGVPQVGSTLQQRRPGDRDAAPFAVPLTPGLPDLATMAAGALEVLGADPDGFFLMVEGGAIDWASHDHQSGRMIEEMLDFDRAVAAVDDWLRRRKLRDATLLIVTSDHECGYLTGPDAAARGAASPPLGQGKGRLPLLVWNADGHTNSLVPLYARGPGAERLRAAATGRDPVWGPYIDNAEVGRILHALWPGPEAAAGEATEAAAKAAAAKAAGQSAGQPAGEPAAVTPAGR